MTGPVVVLTGGVGGAKLVLGLSKTVAPAELTAIVNTGDDFTHLGLHVSPDIDTLLYTLSGKADPEKGWGRANESWRFMAAVGELGGPTWFALGDADLASHVLRTASLRDGTSLSAVTAALSRQLRVDVRVVPMSDDPVATRVATDIGELEFQRYFVEQRCIPAVSGISFAGAATASPASAALAALADPKIRAIIIAPSNPFLSVDPILALPGMREAIKRGHAPVVAVSPIVAGRAVKGPTTKLMTELGLPVSAQSVADHYHGLIDGMLIDENDADGLIGIAHSRADIMMGSLDDKIRVARAALAFADSLRR